GYYSGVSESGDFGFDLKYYYNITDHGRIEPFVSYMFCNTGDGKNEYMAGINYHQFLNKVNRTRPYLIIGAAFGHLYDWDGEVDDLGVFRGGFGLDYRITHSLSFQAELTGSLTYDGGAGFIAPQLKVGLSYNF
ncbi:MAG: porin family protein, partial [Prevotella sp.]|nr:porin family protein [Prevotella sp.]